MTIAVSRIRANIWGLCGWLLYLISIILDLIVYSCLFYPCLEVIKLEYNLKLKIKGNDPPLADICTFVRKHPIIALYFESENELKFHNLEAWCLIFMFMIPCIGLVLLTLFKSPYIMTKT